MTQTVKKPLSQLQRALNRSVTVRLKSNLEYRGVMVNVDPHMNMMLIDAQEYNAGALSANYGRVVIRGNNVLFVKIEETLK